MLTVSVPGKLYLIGEYNVLNDGKSAILFTIDKYVKAMIEPSEHFVLVNEKQVYPLIIDNGHVLVEDDSLKISEGALQIALNYLTFLGIKPKPFRLTLVNELVSKEGIKYGFGSSAAILIAILKSILLYHEVKFNHLSLFKIAVLGQYLIGKKSSGGDLASVIYGGVIFYTRYAYDWVKSNIHRNFKLIEEDWPLLEIEPLPFDHLSIQVGWTGSAYSTDANLAKLLHKEDIYFAFTDKANAIVLKAKQAILDHNNDELGAMISRYQALLYKLDFDLELGFNTDILNTLIKIGDSCRGFSKISGAGYGDCGLSLSPHPQKLHKAWKQGGIIPIKFKIASPLKENIDV